MIKFVFFNATPKRYIDSLNLLLDYYLKCTTFFVGLRNKANGFSFNFQKASTALHSCAGRKGLAGHKK